MKEFIGAVLYLILHGAYMYHCYDDANVTYTGEVTHSWESCGRKTCHYGAYVVWDGLNEASSVPVSESFYFTKRKTYEVTTGFIYPFGVSGEGLIPRSKVRHHLFSIMCMFVLWVASIFIVVSTIVFYFKEVDTDTDTRYY